MINQKTNPTKIFAVKIIKQYYCKFKSDKNDNLTCF